MIPAFTAAGVLPPFVADPADIRQRSPYATRLRDIILRFATSARRCEILQGWLAHRTAPIRSGSSMAFSGPTVASASSW